MQKILPAKYAQFRRFLKRWYAVNQRALLPWRKDHSPYSVLVSEYMLQQTQVARVIPKYELWMKALPTLEALARASDRQVLELWSGLGYNRRALALKRVASECVIRYGGALPQSASLLMELPGIGPYTAGAILAFAYDTFVPVVETNIRTVLLYHFFGDEVTSVADADLLRVCGESRGRMSARVWYSALMDYGTHLKASGVRANNRIKQYKKQSTFRGSLREVRGAIVKLLVSKDTHYKDICKALEYRFAIKRMDQALESLEQSGLIHQTKGKYTLGTTNKKAH